jgi:putative transposase
VDSLKHCQVNQGLQIQAWVIMTNHFHMICSFKDGYDPGTVIKNIKSFTALKIIDAIINNPKESRKEWLLPLFEKFGAEKKSNYKYQFWQHENHPILLATQKIYDQRMDYLHNNPVKAGFVLEPQQWLYGSGMDYYSTEKGLINLYGV